ncbi:MAG: hypothetical protein EP330_08790 [Deltaproteobacteria bacterium]|nr:MAG: hypothetical protein EP330_08790 [Deltaproteobacteria bacterium]
MLPLLLASAAVSAPPAVSVELEAPWSVGHDGGSHLNLRYGDSAEGVRVQLEPSEDWPIGVSPIQGGRPMRAHGALMVAPPLPPARVEIRSEGPDLLVRLFGPPLNALTDREDAPEDPTLTWVRLRPRGSSWRIVLDGVGQVAVEGSTCHWTGRAWKIGEHTELQTAALAWRSWIDADAWFLDVTPAVELADPYPRTAWTWTPE